MTTAEHARVIKNLIQTHSTQLETVKAQHQTSILEIKQQRSADTSRLESLILRNKNSLPPVEVNPLPTTKSAAVQTSVPTRPAHKISVNPHNDVFEVGDWVTVWSYGHAPAEVIEVNPGDYTNRYRVKFPDGKKQWSQSSNLFRIRDPLPPRGPHTLLQVPMEQLEIGDRVSIKSLDGQDGHIMEFDLLDPDTGDDREYQIIVLPETGRPIYTTAGNLLKVMPEIIELDSEEQYTGKGNSTEQEVIEIQSEDERHPEEQVFAIGERILFYPNRKARPIEGIVERFNPFAVNSYQINTKTFGIQFATLESLERAPDPTSSESRREATNAGQGSSGSQPQRTAANTAPSRAAQSKSRPAQAAALRVKSNAPSDPHNSSSDSGSDHSQRDRNNRNNNGPKGNKNSKSCRSVRSPSGSTSSKRAPPPVPPAPQRENVNSATRLQEAPPKIDPSIFKLPSIPFPAQFSSVVPSQE